jgi:ABC-type glycerol-3-phosphate transport system substrate-binding protein
VTGRPELDGSVTNPDTARARAVQIAAWLAGPSGQTADGMAARNGRALARLVLWLDTHLSTAGALPTRRAADGTSRDDDATRPVEDTAASWLRANRAALEELLADAAAHAGIIGADGCPASSAECRRLLESLRRLP